MSKNDYIALGVFAALVAVIPLVIRNDYYLSVLVFAAINCLACLGLSLLMGYAGQISLGHAAFIGIGAYASGILTVKLGWSPWTAMIAGVALVVVISLSVGIPTLRLKGHYLAMATLGFGSIVHIVAVAAVDLTGGPEGISSIPNLTFFGMDLETDTQWFYFSWGVVLLGLLFALNLIHSRMGRAFRAIHGSEDAAGSLGINTAGYKIQIFILGAVYASVAGSIYAYNVNYIDPGPFGVMHSVMLLTMVAIGGIHSIWGAVLGALLLSLLPEFLSSITEYFDFLGVQYNQDYDILIYGGILLAIMLFLPEGLIEGLAGLRRAAARFLPRLQGGAEQGE